MNMNKTILLIEDNASMRDNTRELLELSAYKVYTAENGKIGVELAKKVHPDLILCDINMPELDGYGVLHILGKSEDTAGIPFVFLTARVERVDFRKGMTLGADDYLTKPFDDVELLDVVEMRLRKADLFKKEVEKADTGFDRFINDAKETNMLSSFSNERSLKKHKKKESIFTEGNYPVGLYLISKGKVKTYKTNEAGKELITGIYKEGDFVGYVPLLEDTAYTESAEALEEAEIYLIPKQDFFSLIYNSREVSRKFIQLLSNNLSEREDRLIKLAYNSVRKRVAESLVMLQHQYQENKSGKTSIPISREDLAGIVGTATESVIRTLGDFKEEGLIEIKKGDIFVLSLEKLKELKN
jgi:CRP-like cAMP-binding protein/ActR/RegA family two-component response regulator